MQKTKLPLWTPNKGIINSSQLNQFSIWLENQTGATFPEYKDLWNYSTQNIESFWQYIAEYFKVIFHTKPSSILEGNMMPDFKWFPDATVNYAEHVFRNFKDGEVAIIFKHEGNDTIYITWNELANEVKKLQNYFRSIGIGKGDCIVGYLPNIPEATYAFLAATSLGAIWSSASPDFGVDSILDRFGQIKPKILFATDGYTYNGKPYSKLDIVSELSKKIDSLQKVIVIPFLNKEVDISNIDQSINYADIHIAIDADNYLHDIDFTAVPFEHPLWVLYSSGTTGAPKAITHSHGGCLLEHLKYLAFHNDVKKGEKFFWYSTTGWMMWNYVNASLLLGAKVVLYEGSTNYPDLNALWQFAAEEKIAHFGTSAPFIVACMKNGINPQQSFDLSNLRSISSTGAPLPPEGFKYVYEKIKSDVWLVSMSGGTDVCTAFVGGCITRPVFEGEIQCRALGVDLHAFDENGTIVKNEIGEMVIKKPMPSMPIYFWNDPDKKRYRESYFEMFDGIWRHGDWIKITDHDGIIIFGRSDATLNRHGVRIGTAEIYRAVNKISSIKDSIVVNIEGEDGSHYMPLFIVMNEGEFLSNEIKKEIQTILRKTYSPRHVPDEIFEVNDIPYTISGKKMEAPLKKILMGKPIDTSINKDAMRNPKCIEEFKKYIV